MRLPSVLVGRGNRNIRIRIANQFESLMADNERYSRFQSGDVQRHRSKPHTHFDRPALSRRIRGWLDNFGNLWTFRVSVERRRRHINWLDA